MEYCAALLRSACNAFSTAPASRRTQKIKSATVNDVRITVIPYLFVQYLERKNFEDYDKVAIVSPDAGGVERARRVADKLNCSVVTILKRRLKENQIDSMQIIGDVAGFTCVIVDDMVDTAGTLVKAAEMLKEAGAIRILACASHGVLSGPALQRISESSLEEVVVTDSIPQAENKANCAKLRVLPLGPLLAEVIRRIHNEESVSSIFRTPLQWHDEVDLPHRRNKTDSPKATPNAVKKA